MTFPESPWTLEAVQTLVALAKQGVPPSVISLKIKRSVADVRAKLVDLGLSPPAEAGRHPAIRDRRSWRGMHSKGACRVRSGVERET